MAYFPDSQKAYSGYAQPFHMEPAKKDVMGYRLIDEFLAAGDVILPGTPIKTDPNGTDVANGTKTASICRYAVVEAVAADKKTLTVKRGHFLKAGNSVAISGATTLTALTIASADKEQIVLSAVNNDVVAGSILVEVATNEGVVAAAQLPNRIVDAVAEIDATPGSAADLGQTCSATHDVVVLQNVVKYPAEYINKTAFPGTELLIGCPKIMLIVQ